MTTPDQVRPAVIDFDWDIERLIGGFVGREWLLAQLERWAGRARARA